MPATTIIKPDGSSFELPERVFGPGLLFKMRHEQGVYFGQCYDSQTNQLLASLSLGQEEIPKDRKPWLYIYGQIWHWSNLSRCL